MITERNPVREYRIHIPHRTSGLLERKVLPLMLALLGVGFDLLGYAATIVIEAINLSSPYIRYG